MKALVVASVVLLVAACARPPLAVAPSPSIGTSPVAEVSPVTSPTSSPAGGPTVAPPTPSRAPILTITNATFHPGEVGVAYAPVTLVATGGVGAYTWSISVGSLPAGLTVTTDGVVSGTPTGAGTPSFTVRVADTHGGSAIVNRSISVARRLGATSLCATQCNVELGCVTVCGKFGTIGGGVGPFRYALTGGTSLPPGMGLSGLSLTGPFPAEAVGTVPLPYRFTITATDSFGVTANVSAVFHVFAHISLTGAQCNGGTGAPFNCAMPITGGSRPVSAALYKGTLPPGSKLSVDPVKMVVIISVPTQTISASYAPVITVTDSSPCGPGLNCTSTPATENIRV